jgi:hypothetical protein
MRVNGIKGWPFPSLPHAPSLNCPINQAPFTVYFAPLHSSSPEATITTTQRQGSQRSTRHHHYRAVHAAGLSLLVAHRPHRPFFLRTLLGRFISVLETGASHGPVHVCAAHRWGFGQWEPFATRTPDTKRPLTERRRNLQCLVSASWLQPSRGQPKQKTCLRGEGERSGHRDAQSTG